jgi:hypothetical protein
MHRHDHFGTNPQPGDTYLQILGGWPTTLDRMMLYLAQDNTAHSSTRQAKVLISDFWGEAPLSEIFPQDDQSVKRRGGRAARQRGAEYSTTVAHGTRVLTACRRCLLAGLGSCSRGKCRPKHPQRECGTLNPQLGITPRPEAAREQRGTQCGRAPAAGRETRYRPALGPPPPN